MTTYTTCRDCNLILETLDGQNHHKDCQPRPTEPEALAALWLEAAQRGDQGGMDMLQAEIDRLDTRPPRLAEAADVYAAWGWRIFPLRPGTKVPATQHGFKDATSDPDKIKHWWTQNPNYNIGAATGHMFDVIDIDTPIDFDSIAALEEYGFLDEIHAHVATASGGAHYYVRPTGRGNQVNMVPKIDYRGAGGYVVVPPSVTRDGHLRSWSYVTPPSPQLKAR